jgi:hypothetical protein
MNSVIGSLVRLVALLSLCSFSGWVVVECVDLNGTAVKVGRTAYFLNSSFKYTFPDRYTFNAMGFEFGKIPGQSKDFINSIANPPRPLATLWDHHPNQKLLVFANSSFLRNPRIVFKGMLNPSYVYWNNHIVVSWRFTPEVTTTNTADWHGIVARASPLNVTLIIPRIVERS